MSCASMQADFRADNCNCCRHHRINNKKGGPAAAAAASKRHTIKCESVQNNAGRARDSTHTHPLSLLSARTQSLESRPLLEDCHIEKGAANASVELQAHCAPCWLKHGYKWQWYEATWEERCGHNSMRCATQETRSIPARGRRTTLSGRLSEQANT